MNRLHKESSPYLLQHANNPVEWFPWSQDAFDRAQSEDKPILVSIGYATCHWCHVMERESFEDDSTAMIMNQYFVNIKVDREERPDVDKIYMEAAQILTGSGGWPLNVFLTPDLKPFYAGTYFPPENKYGRPSWKQVLVSIANAWAEKRDQILTYADNLTRNVKKSQEQFLDLEGAENSSWIDEAYAQLQKRIDHRHGGFGSGQKFPSINSLQLLLDFNLLTKHKNAIEHVELSLNKMIQGGIYDQVGGGFARYTTDPKWLVPHFEKMLYDNAMMLSMLAEIYKVSPQATYKHAIHQTAEWLLREMKSESGGFYSALDADSEGVEGKYYVWSNDEIKALLNEEEQWILEWYGVLQEGNWEGVNILHQTLAVAERASQMDLTEEQFLTQVKKINLKLLEYRARRIRPITDTKILFSWNALLGMGFTKLHEIFPEQYPLSLATDLYRSLKEMFFTDGNYYHNFLDRLSSVRAFLDDMAYYINLALSLYENSFEKAYLQDALQATDYVLQHYFLPDSYTFKFSQESAELPSPLSDIHDYTLPSGNGMMLKAMMRLYYYTGNGKYKEIADKGLQRLKGAAVKYPSSFSHTLSLCLYSEFGWNEIAILGDRHQEVGRKLRKIPISNRILCGGRTTDPEIPLLNRDVENDLDTWIYVCKDFVCHRPIKEIDQFKELLQSD